MPVVVAPSCSGPLRCGASSAAYLECCLGARCEGGEEAQQGCGDGWHEIAAVIQKPPDRQEQCGLALPELLAQALLPCCHPPQQILSFNLPSQDAETEPDGPKAHDFAINLGCMFRSTCKQCFRTTLTCPMRFSLLDSCLRVMELADIPPYVQVHHDDFSSGRFFPCTSKLLLMWQK